MFFCFFLTLFDLGLNTNNNIKEVNLTNYVDILYVVGNIDWWISEIKSFAMLEVKPRYGLAAAAVADPKDALLSEILGHGWHCSHRQNYFA